MLLRLAQSLLICLVCLLIQLILIAVSVWEIFEKLSSAFFRCRKEKHRDHACAVIGGAIAKRDTANSISCRLIPVRHEFVRSAILHYSLAESLNRICVPK